MLFVVIFILFSVQKNLRVVDKNAHYVLLNVEFRSVLYVLGVSPLHCL
jgi:hypothetical protein